MQLDHSTGSNSLSEQPPLWCMECEGQSPAVWNGIFIANLLDVSFCSQTVLYTAMVAAVDDTKLDQQR